jgi:hypothetical protein
VPSGWQPTQTHSGNYIVTTPGAVIENLRVVDGTLQVRAPNVTIRRVQVVNGAILTQYGCQSGLLIEDTSVVRGGANNFRDVAIGVSGYTARRVLIDAYGEGFRVGSGCGPVVIENSYARISAPPDPIGDWHGDALQSYPANDALTIRTSVLEIIGRNDSFGTAALNFSGPSANINGLVAKGGSITVRLDAPGSVGNLYVIKDAWKFGPTSVNCGLLSIWTAWLATYGGGQPVPVSVLPCT